ncbi:MAG TPA: CIA30 family protein [Burkholderiales bacterium]|nr:CIA30 family protein [Burkholderiales bacterium]
MLATGADNTAMRELARFDDPGSVRGWSPIDDVVMGGVSSSRLRFDPAGHAVFEGVVSLENHGGFASVRAAPGDYAAPGAQVYLLSVRGDGKRYKLTLRADSDFDGVNYQSQFAPPAGQWAELRLAADGFRASFRGREVPAPPLDPGRVRQLGLMISGRQAGPFSLELRWIRAE